MVHICTIYVASTIPDTSVARRKGTCVHHQKYCSHALLNLYSKSIDVYYQE